MSSPGGLGHFLSIRMYGREPDWPRAHRRLELLIDEQLIEGLVHVGNHGGSGADENMDRAALREMLGEMLTVAEEGILSRPSPDGSFVGDWEAIAGYWQGSWHKILFMLSALGLLQAAGYTVDGYNVPVITYDMPVDYWPPDGLKLFWSPPGVPEG